MISTTTRPCARNNGLVPRERRLLKPQEWYGCFHATCVMQITNPRDKPESQRTRPVAFAYLPASNGDRPFPKELVTLASREGESWTAFNLLHEMSICQSYRQRRRIRRTQGGHLPPLRRPQHQ